MDGGGVMGIAAEVAPDLPVARLVVGQPVEAAAALLPRLFNLCRAAQGSAARLAFGLPLDPGAGAALRAEILRDHMMKLFLTWPGFFGLPPQPFAPGWQAGSAALRAQLFGATGRAPGDAGAFEDFLCRGIGVGDVLGRIDRSFAPGEAVAEGLPEAAGASLFELCAVENSVAGRNARHPVMRHIAATRGCGPLWRAAARIFDVQACLDGSLPPARRTAPGAAQVPAARGTYAVSARVEDGRVCAFARVTPTDHMMAPGGIMYLSLINLTQVKAGLAPLLMDILDPCVPVRLREVAHA